MRRIAAVLMILVLAGPLSAATLYQAQCSNCQGPRKLTIDGLTTGTGTSYQLNYAVPVVTFEMYCTGTTVSTGTIVIEYAPVENQTGTWTTLYTWTAALAPKTVAFYGARFGVVRARFTADLTGTGTPLAYVALTGSGY